jgi:hypothetical protein
MVSRLASLLLCKFAIIDGPTYGNRVICGAGSRPGRYTSPRGDADREKNIDIVCSVSWRVAEDYIGNEDNIAEAPMPIPTELTLAAAS